MTLTTDIPLVKFGHSSAAANESLSPPRRAAAASGGSATDDVNASSSNGTQSRESPPHFAPPSYSSIAVDSRNVGSLAMSPGLTVPPAVHPSTGFTLHSSLPPPSATDMGSEYDGSARTTVVGVGSVSSHVQHPLLGAGGPRRGQRSRFILPSWVTRSNRNAASSSSTRRAVSWEENRELWKTTASTMIKALLFESLVSSVSLFIPTADHQGTTMIKLGLATAGLGFVPIGAITNELDYMGNPGPRLEARARLVTAIYGTIVAVQSALITAFISTSIAQDGPTGATGVALSVAAIGDYASIGVLFALARDESARRAQRRSRQNSGGRASDSVV